MKNHIIVANSGSYYHEGFWTGREKKFSYDIRKAILMEHEEAKKELKYIKDNISCSSSTSLIIISV